MKTERKILALFLVMAMLLTQMVGFTLDISAETTTGSCNRNITWAFDSETGVLTVEGTGSMPDYGNGSAPWYSLRAKITAVKVAEGVEKVGKYAFGGLTALTEVSLPESLLILGEYAFSGCTALRSIHIPENVTLLYGNTFAYCPLDTLTADVANEFYYVDGGCLINILNGELVAGTNSAVIPDDGMVEGIAAYAFSGRTALTGVTIPDSVTAVGAYAFDGCTALTGVTVPDSVTAIKDHAFHGCTALTDAVIGEGVTSVGTAAFYNCTALENLTVGSSVKSIGQSAFYN